MNIDWIEWLGRGMQLALAVVVVGGVYGMATEASRKQDALCDVALSYVEALDNRAHVPRQELKRAEEAASDACARPDDYQDY